MAYNLLIKDIKYDSVRLTITGEEDSNPTNYYTEAEGNRYYYKPIGSTASPNMEAATFKSFLSFTQSGSTYHQYDLIPLFADETVLINTDIIGINADGTKGFVMKAFGGYKHDGTNISPIGFTLDYNFKSDFSNVVVEFDVTGTNSVSLTFTGQSGEDIDWNVYLNYAKGFHDLSNPNNCNDGNCKPIWPQI
jgi:hypothetical protein